MRQQVAADALFAQSSINVPSPGWLWKRNGCEFTTYLSVYIVESLTRTDVSFIRFNAGFGNLTVLWLKLIVNILTSFIKSYIYL